MAKDVAEVLGYASPKDAISAHCKCAKMLKSGESPLLDIPSRGLTIIPERDIYRLVMKSKLPSAEKFEEWVLQPIARMLKTPGLTCLQAVTCIVSAPAWMVSPCRMSKAAEVWRLYSTGLLPPSLVGGGRNL